MFVCCQNNPERNKLTANHGKDVMTPDGNIAVFPFWKRGPLTLFVLVDHPVASDHGMEIELIYILMDPFLSLIWLVLSRLACLSIYRRLSRIVCSQRENEVEVLPQPPSSCARL